MTQFRITLVELAPVGGLNTYHAWVLRPNEPAIAETVQATGLRSACTKLFRLHGHGGTVCTIPDETMHKAGLPPRYPPLA